MIEIRHLDWELGIEIEDWCCESGWGIRIGNWDFGLGLRLGIGIGD